MRASTTESPTNTNPLRKLSSLPVQAASKILPQLSPNHPHLPERGPVNSTCSVSNSLTPPPCHCLRSFIDPFATPCGESSHAELSPSSRGRKQEPHRGGGALIVSEEVSKCFPSPLTCVAGEERNGEQRTRTRRFVYQPGRHRMLCKEWQ